MIEEKKSEIIAQVIAVGDLPKSWYKVDPVELKLGNNYPFGSKNLSKMIMFLKNTKITKDQVDYWLDFNNFPASRNTNEVFEDYKIRMKFQNTLIKYRKEVRAFVMLYKMQDTMEEIEKNKQNNLKTQESK